MSKKEDFPSFFPILYDVEANQCYRWCGCGLSKTQPLCDREDCGDKCVKYCPSYAETVSFCGCKKTRTPPFCDGSHAELLREYLRRRKTKT